MSIIKHLKDYELHCLEGGQLQVAELVHRASERIAELEEDTKSHRDMIKLGLTMKRRIAELEKENARLDKRVQSTVYACGERDIRVAELKKELLEDRSALEWLVHRCDDMDTYSQGYDSVDSYKKHEKAIERATD